ncbi:DUF4142 domain-containing protein [Flavobacterium sp. JP2137]|uniref:DUF4142 domain-containing protein n=1 Tax=Flavobacterium sp. JP2137 TaxID=3414510 RepID=UPI003D2FC802
MKRADGQRVGFLIFGLLAIGGLWGCKKEHIPSQKAVQTQRQERVLEAAAQYKEDIVEILVDDAEFTLYQLRINKLAEQKSGTAAVQTWAKSLLDYEGDAHRELIELARRYEVLLPEVVSAEKNDQLEKLATTDSSSFDRRYLHLQVEEYTDAVEAIAAVLAQTQDDTIRLWADGKRLVLENCLTEVQEIQRNLK